MIEVRQVTYSYERSAVLKDVSLELRKGECLSILGPNASGKSTLALVMKGLLVPDAGDCLVDGVSTKEDSMHARLNVGLVFQDPDDQMVAHKVEDDIAFGPMNAGIPDIPQRVSDALASTGIENLRGREIASLSGGQRQLVAIAGALAMRPAYMILDEPTSFLDAAGTRLVIEAIRSMRDESKGVAIVTHDPRVASIADRCALLKDGQATRQGSPDEIFEDDSDDNIAMPELGRLYSRLRRNRAPIGHPALDARSAVEAVCRLRQKD
ncbi:MAG TPA: ATP-binding cassette domain-containing protein [Methanocella sp.]|nr:ATP-binding cassette domain-containing protein [Methanocella sp.]